MATETLAQRAQVGRAARKQVPRASQSELQIAADRDPIGLLEEQARSRVPELVPIRYGRMLVSPFAFLRGAAIVMAHDLVDTPVAGLSAQLCGGAHLAHFGGFASPGRDPVFDLNDFDETPPGPLEWDVQRPATSLQVAGTERAGARGHPNVPPSDAPVCGGRRPRRVVLAPRRWLDYRAVERVPRPEGPKDISEEGCQGSDARPHACARQAHGTGRRQAAAHLGSAAHRAAE